MHQKAYEEGTFPDYRWLSDHPGIEIVTVSVGQAFSGVRNKRGCWTQGIGHYGGSERVDYQELPTRPRPWHSQLVTLAKENGESFELEL